MNTDPASHEEQLKKAERIASLIAGHLKGTLTNEEADELDNWITESDKNLELFENLTDEDNIEHAMHQYMQAEQQKAAAFEELKQNIKAGGHAKRFRPWQLIVAASVLVLTVSIYFIVQKNQQITTEKPIAQKGGGGEIWAGSNKAVLTLSDGRTIILDTASSGTVVMDGSVNIRQDNGELIYSGNQNNMAYNTISTPRGGQFQLTLGDGTKVWLNAESSLKFPAGMATAQRVVEIRGEAYFEVAKNAANPFRVRVMKTGSEEATIEVLGTHFNVNAYGGKIATTLLEGSIRVERSNEEKMLSPGQQAVIGKSIQIKKVDVTEAVAWKEGRFLFRDATVEAMAEEIKRWYDVEVEINGTIAQHFNMEISRQVPLSRLLAGLEKTGQVQFTLSGRKLTIRP